MRKKFINLLLFFLLEVCFISLLVTYGRCAEKRVRLFYKIYYGPFKIGESTIEITSEKYTAIVYDVGWVRWFFPYYAKWETWVDKNGYPKKVVIYSKERKKERKRVIYFKKNERKIIYQEILPKYKRPKNLFIDFPIYDELSALVFSFYINYTKHSQIELPLFIKESRAYMELKFKERKICKFKKEKRKCLFIKVFLPKKSELLKRSSKAEMLLLEKERVPLELRGKLSILGSLVGKLEKIDYILNYPKK